MPYSANVTRSFESQETGMVSWVRFAPPQSNGSSRLRGSPSVDDPDDEPLLQMAVEATVPVIVARDVRHLPAARSVRLAVIVLVTFALLGRIPLTIGVVGHEGSTVVVVMNSLRLLFGAASPGRDSQFAKEC